MSSHGDHEDSDRDRDIVRDRKTVRASWVLTMAETLTRYGGHGHGHGHGHDSGASFPAPVNWIEFTVAISLIKTHGFPWWWERRSKCARRSREAFLYEYIHFRIYFHYIYFHDDEVDGSKSVSKNHSIEFTDGISLIKIHWSPLYLL